jgi:hypothetical protein
LNSTRDSNSSPTKKIIVATINIDNGQGQEKPARQQGKQGLGNLIEAYSLATGREPHATLQEAGKQIANHGHKRDQGSDFPR